MKSLGIFIVPLGGFLQKMRCQEGNVFRPIPQGGQMDMDRFQPVQQIQSEAAFLTGLIEVFIGGGDDPHIDTDRFGRSEREEGFFFQHTEQF